VYGFLCDTLFAPLFTFDGGWLANEAFEAHMLGLKLTH